MKSTNSNPNLLLLILLHAHHTTKLLAGTRDIVGSSFRLGRNRLSDLVQLSWSILALIIFPLPLSSVDAVLASHITDGLGNATFAELAANCVVDAVLEIVNLLDTGDFGLAEGIYASSCQSLRGPDISPIDTSKGNV